MRDKPSDYLEARRVRRGPTSSTPADGMNGQFIVYHQKRPLLIQASDREGWEHVSVSRLNSDIPPTWGDMCFVKGLFWEPDEWVIQYHPSEKDYINHHPGCLHLWRPVGQGIPIPPVEFV